MILHGENVSGDGGGTLLRDGEWAEWDGERERAVELREGREGRKGVRYKRIKQQVISGR